MAAVMTSQGAATEILGTADELVATLRHDLSQPLTALLTMADLLAMKLERAGLADEARNAERIRAVAERLDSLVQERLVPIGRRSIN